MMKHFRVILPVILIFTACDRKAIHEYYIQNNCKETIIVDVWDYKNKFSSIEIDSNEKEIIYVGETIVDVYEDEITYFIKKIRVKKGNIFSSIDLLDYRIWHFEKKSRLEAKSSLTICPEDFE